MFESKLEKELAEAVKDQAAAILNLTKAKPDIHLVLLSFLNHNKFIIMELTIAANQSAPIILGLVDAVTNLPVSGTFAGTTNTVDNTAIASVDANGNLVGVPGSVAAGASATGNLTTVTNATYTDSTGAVVTKSLTTVTPFTVTGVATADQVNLVISLGTPVTQS